jgi:ubiquinone/menaquinone biosynthesis C-methylase UbiE
VPAVGAIAPEVTEEAMAQPATWDEIAAWFDDKQGDGGDLWHAVLRLLGPVEGRTVLDLACGNGALARGLARSGARVTGADLSRPLIDRARAREVREPLGIGYVVEDAAALPGSWSGSFDLVVGNMALMDIPNADVVIREASRVLRPAGRFIASLVHPCFETPRAAMWVFEKSPGSIETVWRKVGRYREVRDGTFWWRIGPGQARQTRWYHRPMSWYARAFGEAGLGIVGMEEPAPTEEFLAEDDDGRFIVEMPLHCVFEAVKLGAVPER